MVEKRNQLGLRGLPAIAALVLFSGFSAGSLKGAWQYCGGVYNGKPEGPPEGYVLRRVYDDAHFQAFLYQKGYRPEKYEAGDYRLKGDSCIETETYSKQPSQLLKIPVSYRRSRRHDTLVLQATLPSGMRVEEYWKRVK